MYHHTQAVLLHSIKYKENSKILTCYTATAGKQSFMCKTFLGKKKQIFNPFTLTEIEYIQSAKHDLWYINRINYTHIPMHILHDIRKRNIASFLSEFLYRTIQEKEHNPVLFSYIESSIKYLEELEHGIANFHLYFMVKFIKILGISPETERLENQYFNIDKSVFAQYTGEHTSLSDLFHYILSHPVEEVLDLSLSRKLRTDFIRSLLKFISYHLPVKFNDKSFEIYLDIFNI